MADHLIVFQPSGRQAHVAHGTPLLNAARQLGVDLDSICGGRQTCGKCKVLVEAGHFVHHGIVSAPEHLTPAGALECDYFGRRPSAAAPNARLACAACVSGDLLVTVPPESQAHRQLIRKSAGARPITLDPMLRQLFVEVAAHELGARLGDWERLQQALADEWGLHDLRIDLPALRRLSPALKEGGRQLTVIVWNEREVIDLRPGYQEGLYGLAVDVGSTTLAGHLCDLSSGAMLASEALINPQVSFGEDLMSRVSYAMLHENGLQKMQQAIIGALNQLAARAAAAAGLQAGDILEAVLVGNTVMHHIMLGLDPTPLGAAPFTLTTHAPLDLKARDLGLKLHAGANVHFPALEAGHVGSDNVAVLLAEAPEQQDELVLVIDVGTNAEILLGNREQVLSCSSPTGPAFEGAQITHGQRAAPGAIERVRIERASGAARFQVIGGTAWSDELPAAQIGATGICGSGIIEVVAELFLAGILRPDGRFDPEWRPQIVTANGRSMPAEQPSRLRWNGPKGEYLLATAEQTAGGHEIVVTQDDVRNIQLAKGALYAGCKLLMRRRGVERVDRIVLAGAFGSYIDPLRAMVLGLFPDCDPARVTAVGNAAGDGARIALLNRTRRAESALLARQVHYLETAIDPHFQEEFVGALQLPHMHDSFPHLAAMGMLPADRPARESRERRRERRARLAEEKGL